MIADDHSLFRDGLRRLLQFEPDIDVVGEAFDATSTLNTALELKPDVLLLDLVMPGVSDLDTLTELAESLPASRIILLTASITKEQIVQAIQLGARGVILKETTSQLVFRAIRCVMEGQYWIARDTVADLVDALKGAASRDEGTYQSKDYGITPREREIIELVVAGFTNPDIARKCSISEQTVKHHVSSIYDKLGVFNRVELALFAVHHGLTK
jgi:DNA-binding NarL/FixJ family response regulator